MLQHNPRWNIGVRMIADFGLQISDLFYFQSEIDNPQSAIEIIAYVDALSVFPHNRLLYPEHSAPGATAIDAA
jgi:hypothetical protein